MARDALMATSAASSTGSCPVFRPARVSDVFESRRDDWGIRIRTAAGREIVSTAEQDEDGNDLYWQTELGWVLLADADRFSLAEQRTLHLPQTGHWVVDPVTVTTDGTWSGGDEPLVEAYHAIYDVKDEYLDNDHIRVRCYEALKSVSSLMQDLDIVVPDRHDRDGRS